MSATAPSALAMFWVAVIGVVLVLAALALLSRVWTQRQALEQSRRERIEQSSRLQTLGLLEAIAEGSRDAIFAKDSQGRYVFCNRATAELMQKTREDIIGRTATQLQRCDAADNPLSLLYKPEHSVGP